MTSKKRSTPRPSHEEPRYWRAVKTWKGIAMRRGELAPHVLYPRKSLTSLGIHSQPSGQVSKPRYREVEGQPGRIERSGREKFGDLYTALRQTRHKRATIRGEVHELSNVVRQLSVLHRRIYDEWKTMDESSRMDVLEKIDSLADAVGSQDQLRSQYKLRVLQSLATAQKTLLEKGSHTKALLIMEKGMNDLVARINQLRRTRAFVRRHGDEFMYRISTERGRLERYLKDNFDAIAILQHPLPEPARLGSILKRLEKDYASLGRKREPELKAAQPHLHKARRALEKGDYKECIIQLRYANRQVVVALGRQYMLNPDLMIRLSHMNDKDLRTRIWAKQLQIMAENIEFWHWSSVRRKDAPARLEKLARIVDALALASRPDFQTAHSSIVAASAALKKNDVVSAEGHLMNAIQRTGEEYHQRGLFD